MKLSKHGGQVLALAFALVAAGCATPPAEPEDLLAPKEEQMQLRSMQSRSYEVESRRQAMRGVIEALQDLGFIIERANEPLGLVTAARFAEPRYFDVMSVTVTIREVSEGNFIIRANAIFNNEPITDAKVYQNFFATLERSMFIGRN